MRYTLHCECGQCHTFITRKDYQTLSSDKRYAKHTETTGTYIIIPAHVSRLKHLKKVEVLASSGNVRLVKEYYKS